jgi:type VI protein secretion system component Hcp
MFLFVDQVVGDSQDEQHQGWIDVWSYEHTITHNGEDPGGPWGQGIPNVGAFQVTVHRDGAHVPLVSRSLQRTIIPTVMLEVCQPTEGRPFCQILVEMEDVRLTSTDTSETGLTEYWFEFGYIKWTLRPLDSSGAPTQPLEGDWNLEDLIGDQLGTGDPGDYLFGETGSPLFLDVNGVSGEATPPGYENWISLFGYQDGIYHNPGGIGGDTRVYHDAQITKQTDIATGAFLNSVLSGDPIDEMTLEEAVGHAQIVVYDVRYEDVFVTELRYGSDQIERIDFDAERVTWDPPSGFSWDFKQQPE